MPTVLLAPGVLALAAALAAGPAVPAKPTPASVSYAERASAQIRFSKEYAKSHPAALATPADLDRFFAELQAAWAKSLGPQPDPVLARLDPLVYLTAMLALTDHKEPDWARCNLWSRHALPAFYADLETMRAAPSAERASLLDGMTLIHVLGYPVFDCDLPQPEWDRYRAAMDELPQVLDIYIERHLAVDERAARTLQRGRDFGRAQRSLLAALDALRRDDLARTRQELVAGFDQGAIRPELSEVGHRLAKAHVARGQVDEALSLLDLITRSTAVSELSGETLGEWYAEADPRRGPERYAQAASARLPVLVPTDERIQLAGRYVDLMTGRPLDLASLAGKTVLLDFWATWCSICLAEVPRLNVLAERLGKDGKLVIVGISSDALTGQKPPESVVRDLARQKGMKYHVVYDRPKGSLTERFGVDAWPTRVLIGADGRRLAPPGTVKRPIFLEDVEAYFETQQPAS